MDGGIMSTLKVNSIEPAVSGSETFWVPKVWIHYTQVTPAIRASGNVSSLLDSSTGVFEVNFSNALIDVNYAALEGTNAAQNRLGTISEATSSKFRHVCENDSGTNIDNDVVCFGVIR